MKVLVIIVLIGLFSFISIKSVEAQRYFHNRDLQQQIERQQRELEEIKERQEQSEKKQRWEFERHKKQEEEKEWFQKKRDTNTYDIFKE